MKFMTLRKSLISLAVALPAILAFQSASAQWGGGGPWSGMGDGMGDMFGVMAVGTDILATAMEARDTAIRVWVTRDTAMAHLAWVTVVQVWGTPGRAIRGWLSPVSLLPVPKAVTVPHRR